MKHETPHVFVPTTDELEVKYRCLLCLHAGRRHRGKIIAYREDRPKRAPYMRCTAGKKPSLDDYDRIFE